MATDPTDFKTDTGSAGNSAGREAGTAIDRGRVRDANPEGGHGSTPPIGTTLLAGAVAAMVVLPIIWIASVALTVDLDRLVSLVFQSRTAVILANTVALVGIVTTLSVVLAVPLSFLTTLTDLPFRRFWLVALAVPLVVPSFTGAFAFISVWGPRGLVQSLLEPIGVTTLPELYGMWGTIFVLTIYNYPFVFLTTVAGLRTFDKSYLEAARTLDRTRRAMFTRVIVPMAKPAIVAGALLTALETAGDFGVPAMLRFDVLTRQIYVEHNALAHEYAAMLSLHLVALTLVILTLEAQVRDHARFHGSARGESRSYTMRLGRWKWPALAVCAVVVLLSVVLPVSFLTWWLVRGPESYVGAFAFEWTYAINSMTVSTLAAVVAATCALPVAYLAARYRSTTAAVIERATYVGFAVPGVVIGLSLVHFGSTALPAVYQTLPLVVFAYVVLYLPLAVGSTRTSILYVNPHVVDAARTLGRTPFGAFRQITFPLMLPGVIAGAALVFLHGMKELPATLLLRPAEFETLATFIWTAERNAYYGYAALPALVLILVSGLSILAVVPRDWRGLGHRSGVTGSDGEPSQDDSKAGSKSIDTDSGTADDNSLVGTGETKVTESSKSTASSGGHREQNRDEHRDIVLELETVTKVYDDHVAVEDLSITVGEGELLSLLGPSGCGKTTTLRLIAGLERPDGGRIAIRGKTVADASQESPYVPAERRDVGIVFQDFALFPHKTVAENVAFGLGSTEDTNDSGERVDELLELVGLAAYHDQYPHALSGGQKQRVALARSLAPEPDLLLLDEPLSNLDARLRVRMRNTITSILESVSVTAVWVTHDQAEALSVGDRVAILNAGRLEQTGHPRTVFTNPSSRMVAEFLGRARYLTARVEDGMLETPIGRIDRERTEMTTGEPDGDGPTPHDGENVDLLVRPDDVTFEPIRESRSEAHGQIVDRRYTGTTVTYLIELENSDIVESTQSHEDWFERGTPVDVSITASHDLPTFER